MNPRLDVTSPAGPRRRLTVLVRPLLALPHILIVGGPALGVMGGGFRFGVYGALAFALALLDWFAILITGRPLAGVEELKRGYLRWRARVLAYAAFLRDEYPPFGEAAYPAELLLPATPSEPRDRLAVGLRPLLLVPHLLVVAVLLIVWVFAAIAAWLIILVTGRMPPALWVFSRDVIAYVLRVETYALLIHDQYPPFRLTADEPALDEGLAPLGAGT